MSKDVRDFILAKAFELRNVIDGAFPEWKDRECARMQVLKIITGTDMAMVDWEKAFKELEIK